MSNFGKIVFQFLQYIEQCWKFYPPEKKSFNSQGALFKIPEIRKSFFFFFFECKIG